MRKYPHTDAVLAGLKALYPDAKPELFFRNPYETLVATMLSAQATDKQVNKATPALFDAYPTVQALAAATPEAVFPYVKSCGFRSKAVNIVLAAQKIVADFGGEVPRTMEALTSLPGVGRKTANVVMANAFDTPAIAVDTHVFRVSNRLGLAQADDVLTTEKQLMRRIPREDWRDAHHWLIYHGRRVCRARRPLCGACALQAYCRHWAAEGSADKTARKKMEKPSEQL